MSSFSKRLDNLFLPPSTPTPARADRPEQPEAVAPFGPDFPSTFQAAVPSDGARRSVVFDPALRQFARAFRARGRSERVMNDAEPRTQCSGVSGATVEASCAGRLLRSKTRFVRGSNSVRGGTVGGVAWHPRNSPTSCL